MTKEVAVETLVIRGLAAQDLVFLVLAHLVGITIMVALDQDIKGLEIMEVSINILAKALSIRATRQVFIAIPSISLVGIIRSLQLVPASMITKFRSAQLTWLSRWF